MLRLTEAQEQLAQQIRVALGLGGPVVVLRGAACAHIGMPDISGYELAPMIRELAGLENVVLVAMSGYGSDEDRARSRDCGFDHHLTKPVDPEYLGIVIATAHSQPRLLKSRYGTRDDTTMKPSAAQGPHGA